MEKIKLVIWDLDETFWKGTLSEEGIVPIDANIRMVKHLTDRGIINSIVSKNDFDKARQKLEELEIFDHFVFPSINWDSKGVQIRDIIEKCQLRAVNVLFLDDNHLNLEEAKFYNEGLNVEYPDFIDQMMDHPSLLGKDDSSHTRLNQYKLLEKRHVDIAKVNDNAEFLRGSNIVVHYIDDLKNNADRIHEMIERTNQLNFTKKRISPDEVQALIEDENYVHKLIQVTDKYGDYGVVGFLSFDKTKNKLEHFVFSCRILNLGVEQFLYAKFNFPAIDIVPEVVIELDNSSPDWITEKTINGFETDKPKKGDLLRIFFKGGCDLSQMLHYLSEYNLQITEETNYTAENNFPIHQEHTQMLIDSVSKSPELIGYLVDKLPFIDEKTYVTSLFEHQYDVVVFSVLMDYTQQVFQHNTLPMSVPFGSYSNHLTDVENKSELVKTFHKMKISGITDEFLDFFSANFARTGQITPEEFKKNLGIIRNKIPAHIPIIFINGSELESPDKEEADSYRRHKEMNKALDDFISSNAGNCFLLDVRKIVTDKKQITDNIRHYQRTVYMELAKELIGTIEKVAGDKLEKDHEPVVKQKLRNAFSITKDVLKKSKFLVNIYKKVK